MIGNLATTLTEQVTSQVPALVMGLAPLIGLILAVGAVILIFKRLVFKS